MASPRSLETLVEGRATHDGTLGYQRRFAEARTLDFYRPIGDGPLASSLGLGTYLGECDDAEDARYVTAVAAALNNGVNLIDTAINYRCQRSERAVGEAVRSVVGDGIVKREEIIVCTKGGYIPLDRNPPLTKEAYRNFLEAEYFAAGVMDASDVVAGGHCLTPRYLVDQIERSRTNLGLAVIDIYYLHNPEQQLDSLARVEFLSALRDAFATLEDEVGRGAIGCYGCATWNGFRVSSDSRNHLSLEELISIAREVGGSRHHFKVIQVPINLAMTEAIRAPTQRVGGQAYPLLEAAHRLKVSVVGSATLMQSQLTRSLPAQVHSAFPGFASDARRAIAFAQALPVVSTLVGMRSLSHLEENLALPAQA
ncbi:MAG: aldo/keto reductase [Gemmatimonadaceae bacterium]